MTVLLFAETPRLSNEGHRFLVPVGKPPPESVLGAFARAATEIQPGANFLGKQEGDAGPREWHGTGR